MERKYRQRKVTYFLFPAVFLMCAISSHIYNSWSTIFAPQSFTGRNIWKRRERDSGTDSMDHLKSIISRSNTRAAVPLPVVLKDLQVTEPAEKRTKIALGLTLTSNGIDGLTRKNFNKSYNFFTNLLPTFCETCSAGDNYIYRFYVSIDFDDIFLSLPQMRRTFHEVFRQVTRHRCKQWRGGLSYVSLKLIMLPYNKKPAWAQNDAMMDAYLDENDYYYRLNDDVMMTSRNWTEMLIEGLQKYSPPNVGMISPDHTGGHEDHFEFDFVHRTHIDIFGYYYPRVFLDLYADEWIANVYMHRNTSRKHQEVRIVHTHTLGKRYDEVLPTGGASRRHFRDQELSHDQYVLKRYLYHHGKMGDASLSNNSFANQATQKYIIMSLAGTNDVDTLGAIRNINLAKLILPAWKVRIYISNPSVEDDKSVPERILSKLQRLGAELIQVTPEVAATVPCDLWKLLALDDPDIDVILFRDPASRLVMADVHVAEQFTRGIHADKNVIIVNYDTTFAQPITLHRMGIKVSNIFQTINQRKNITSIKDDIISYMKSRWMRDEWISRDNISEGFVRDLILQQTLESTVTIPGSRLAMVVPFLRRIPRKLRPYYQIGRKYDTYDTLPQYLLYASNMG